MQIKKEKEKVFKELSWIPKYFSTKIFDYHKLNMTQQDVIQELNIALWKSIEFYYKLILEDKKPKIEIKKYCYIAVQNEEINLIRKIHRIKRDIIYTSLSNHDIFQSFGEDISLQISEEGKLIIDGIDILDFPYNEEYKRIFKDLIIGYTFQEVSEIYNIPVGTIKTNIYKMRKIIRKNFREIFQNFFSEKTFYLFKDEDENEDTKKENDIFQERKRIQNFNKRENPFKKFRKFFR